jgi:hypothetical protein
LILVSTIASNFDCCIAPLQPYHFHELRPPRTQTGAPVHHVDIFRDKYCRQVVPLFQSALPDICMKRIQGTREAWLLSSLTMVHSFLLQKWLLLWPIAWTLKGKEATKHVSGYWGDPYQQGSTQKLHKIGRGWREEGFEDQHKKYAWSQKNCAWTKKVIFPTTKKATFPVLNLAVWYLPV